MAKTTQVTSYLFHAPDHYKSAAFIFIFTLFLGFSLNLDLTNFAQNFTLMNIYQNAIIKGLVLFGFPALISGLISTPLSELLGGTLYYKRSFLLALISTGIIYVVMILGKIVQLFFEFNFILIIIFGYALVFSIRHSVLLATSNPKNLNTIFGSINQSVLGFIFLWLIPGTGLIVTPLDIIIMILFVLVFFATTLLWIRIVTTPFRRNFGVDGLLLTKHALTQFTKDYKSGQILETEFFSKIGSFSNLRVGIICIRPSVQNGISKANKVLLVIPSIHPGPFGILGGSNLPIKLYKALRKISKNLMVFHGPAAHAQNPVASTECDKISKKIFNLTKNLDYSDEVGSFRRASLKNTKSSNQNTRSNLTICSQQLGHGMVYVHTSSPEPTDDIDTPTGEAIVVRGMNETHKKSVFIDAHNCLEPGTGEVFFGSEKANNMLKLVSHLNTESENKEQYSLSTGYAADHSFRISDGIGPMGMQVLIISCNPKQNSDYSSANQSNADLPRPKKYAYILLDGNNVMSGLRERLLEAVEPYVDDAEVFTTDNHVVNATMGGYNPIGLKINPDRLIKSSKKLVKQAIMDLEPCEAGVNSGLVKNIKILGENMPMRLSSTINITIAIMKNSLIACQALALSACWAIALMLT
jgi:putative membrane protein